MSQLQVVFPCDLIPRVCGINPKAGCLKFTASHAAEASAVAGAVPKAIESLGYSELTRSIVSYLTGSFMIGSLTCS